ncbi:CBS domain-containing protein [Pseudochelatococcus lubricantis]|uniref:CBS domain-containing protein n=1 Tax=Pseudochelatococcus lubricantis TaxID=1538102 RepID=A0ABX0UYZ6_9HYPH|nr:CBS domain-containing protein [Pseudochelatococcus lubricantis]
MKAADIMTRDVLTVKPEDRIADVVALMLEKKVSGLPVVDAENHLVGVVTEGDFLRRSELDTRRERTRWLEFILGPAKAAADYVEANARRVKDVMTPDPVTVTQYTPLADIVSLFEKHKIKRVPVTANGKLVGIVSRVDLLRALSKQLSRTELASDQTIRDQITAAIAREPWAPPYIPTPDVEDGVVTLRGTIFDATVREALKVLIESVPGVREVRDELVLVEPLSGVILDQPEGQSGRN